MKILKIRLKIGLVLSLPTLLAAGVFVGQAWSQSLQDQLDAAVKDQNWNQAITIIDQMLQKQPQDRITLEAYKQRLLELQATTQSIHSGEGIKTEGIQPAVFPLPSNLARYRYQAAVGDYVHKIDPFPPYVNPTVQGGYLHWTRYPINIYIQSDNRDWYKAVDVGVELWAKYVPLKKVLNPAVADITIQRMPNQGVIAGIAKLTDFYIDDDGTLQHRVQVTIGEYPTEGQLEISVTAAHELGHALGLWGHSDNSQDLMFPSIQDLQSDISPRDLNTLQRIYEEPTLIGVQVPPNFLDNYQPPE